MAVVHPEERAASAGILSGFTQHRCGNRAVIYGTYLVNPVLGLPFLLAGGLKTVYDLRIFAVFRNLRPLEEESATKTAQGS
jgi:hypothetical protein